MQGNSDQVSSGERVGALLYMQNYGGTNLMRLAPELSSGCSLSSQGALSQEKLSTSGRRQSSCRALYSTSTMTFSSMAFSSLASIPQQAQRRGDLRRDMPMPARMWRHGIQSFQERCHGIHSFLERLDIGCWRCQSMS